MPKIYFCQKNKKLFVDIALMIRNEIDALIHNDENIKDMILHLEAYQSRLIPPNEFFRQIRAVYAWCKN